MDCRTRIATFSLNESTSESLPPLGIAPTISTTEGQPDSDPTGEPPPEWIGEYRVIRCVGAGGMGQVFEAHRIIDDHTTMRVAIKLPLAERLPKAEAVERVMQELCAVAQLRHPGIVVAIDWGRLDSGVPYIVMEFLDGELLLDRLQRLRRQGLLLPVRDALRFARQIASAMDVAHAASIVHRDLKPGNIMIVPDPDLPQGERVKIMDFGLAKILNEGRRALTVDGIGVGTSHYMAPEQAQGRAVTAKSDVYSLGILLDQLLCPRALSRIAPALHLLVEAMVSRDPSARPTMREVMGALDQIAADLARADRRWRSWTAGLAALGVVLCSAGSFAAYDWSRPAPAVRAKGSGTIIAAMVKPLKGHLAQCAHVRLEPVDQGSGGALLGLAQGDTELALSSIYIERSAIAADPFFRTAAGSVIAATVIGLDELTVLTHGSNPVRSVPVSALQDLLFIRPGQTAPATTKWAGLGVAAGHPLAGRDVVVLLSRGALNHESGTRQLIEETLRPYPDSTIFDFGRLLAGPSTIPEEVAAEPAALGLVSRAFARADTPSLRVIDDRTGAALTIQRALWAYVATDGDGQLPRSTCSMLRCLLDDDTQARIQRLGLREVPPVTRVEQRTLLGIADGSCRIKAHAEPRQAVVVEPQSLEPGGVTRRPVPVFPHGERPKADQ